MSSNGQIEPEDPSIDHRSGRTKKRKIITTLRTCLRLRRPDRDQADLDVILEQEGLTKTPDDTEKAKDASDDKTESGEATAEKKAPFWKTNYDKLSNLVVDSSQSGYYYWIGIVSATVLYNAIVLPMRSAFGQFHGLCYICWMSVDYLIDMVYLADIFVGSRTGFLEQGLLVHDLDKLRSAYTQRREIYVDILAVLPTDLLYLVPIFNHNAAWLRFNRLLKIYRLFEFADRTETRTTRPNLFRILNLTANIMVLIHWNACIYFGFSQATGLGANSFVYPPRSADDISDESHNFTERWNRLFTQYVYSFYWSTLILTTIGETPKPVENAEYIFITIDFLAGVLIFATVVGNVGAMITNMNAARTDFQNRMDGVKRYMEFRKVNKQLEMRVIRWFDYLWTNKQSLEEDTLNALPDKLKAEIAIHVHFDTLQRVSIFKDCDPGLLIELVLKLKLQVFSPEDYICRKGDIGKEMYIVKRGKLSVVSEDGKTVFVTLGEGSVFGEISILDIAGNKTGNRRSANVRSVGYSDLFCLSKDDLWEALKEYPEAKTILMQRGEAMLRKDNLIDEEVLKKAQEQQETVEQCVDRIDGSLTQLGTRLARLIGEFGASQAKLKRRLVRVEEFQFYMENQGICGDGAPQSLLQKQDGDEENEKHSLMVPRFVDPKISSTIMVQSSKRESLSSLDSSMATNTIPTSESSRTD